MKTTTAPQAIVITGATGTGKSELAVEVAERVGGLVVSADSRQIYRGMDIGTAKPPASALRRVRHRGLDICDPDQRYSAGRFARDAWRWIAEARAAGLVPVITGGTGLFIRALLRPLGPEPALDAGRRERLRRYLAGRSVAELKAWLARLDPRRMESLQGEGGRQRLARSLEVALLSGQAHSWWLDRPPETAPLEALICCLELPGAELRRRIDERFDRMMDAGLLEEIDRLLDRYSADAPGLTSVGYVELAAHLEGGGPLAEAVERAKQSTWRYARRQLTWLRHQLPEGTIRLDGRLPREELTAAIVSCWEERGLAGDRGTD